MLQDAPSKTLKPSVMLRRDRRKDNQKRVCRLYRAEGLSLSHKQPTHLATAINAIWSMDFAADALFDGRRLRALTVVDSYTRERLAVNVGQSPIGEDVVNTLNPIVAHRGLPATIEVDNGSAFISGVIGKWAYERGIVLDFIRPDKPADNAEVESFNGASGKDASMPIASCCSKMRSRGWKPWENTTTAGNPCGVMKLIPAPH